MNSDKFHLIVVVSNPVNFRSRYENYRTMAKDLEQRGVHLWTVELQTGARPHQITDASNDHHVQLWQSALTGELWHKENLINLAVQQVVLRYPDCRYIGYSDGDFLWEADAFEKTVEHLQTYPVVQMWSHLINLDPDGHVMSTAKSFMYCNYTGEHVEDKRKPGFLTPIGAPGGAWAFRREVLNQMGCAISGPVIDFGIIGSGDHYFAHAVMGRIHETTDPRFHPNYNKWLTRYQDVVDPVIRRNVGYVPNTVRHLWHGSKQTRGYNWRANILIECQFDPETDLTRDVSGLWRLVTDTPRQWKMRDEIRKYFRSRREDATTVDVPPELMVQGGTRDPKKPMSGGKQPVAAAVSRMMFSVNPEPHAPHQHHTGHPHHDHGHEPAPYPAV